MQIGYARVSTADQTLALPRNALDAAGCLQPGDTLVVWKLDHLGRSRSHLAYTVASLGERGILFHSLSDPINASRKPILTAAQIAHARLVENRESPEIVAMTFKVGRSTLYWHLKKAAAL